MPRGVFNWTPEDVVRFIKTYGFQLAHSKGSHFYYVGKYSGELRQVSVSFHGGKVLKPKTLNSIIRQSGIPKEKWLNS